jgi:hypothetical protein
MTSLLFILGKFILILSSTLGSENVSIEGRSFNSFFSCKSEKSMGISRNLPA